MQSQQTGVKPVEWVDLERVDNEMQRLSHETRELYNLMTPAFGTSERIKKKIAAIETGLADARAEIKAHETGLAEACAQIKAQQAVFEDVCAQVKAQQDVIKHLQQAMQRQGLPDTSSMSADSACVADARAEIKAQQTGMAEACAQMKAQQAVFEDVCEQVKAQQDDIKHLQQAMQRQGLPDTSTMRPDSARVADVRAEILHGLTQHLMQLPVSSPLSMPPEVNTSSLVFASTADAARQTGAKRTFSQTQPEFPDLTRDANVAKLRKVLVKTDNPADHVLVSDLCASVFDNKLSAKQVSELLAVVIDTKRIGLIDVYEKYVSSCNPDAEPKWIAVGKEQGKKGWVLDAAMLAAVREEVKAKDT